MIDLVISSTIAALISFAAADYFRSMQLKKLKRSFADYIARSEHEREQLARAVSEADAYRDAINGFTKLRG